MKFALEILNVIWIFFLATDLYAEYPSAKSNNNLKNELAQESDRLIPSTDWFHTGVDGQGYFRWLRTDDFYHSFGHWVQIRTEASPNNFLSLNTRSIIYSGSVSEGYSNPTGFYNLFAVSGTLPNEALGGKISFRLGDLERRTFGAGIVMEEKEMSGFYIDWKRDVHSISLLGNGTGGLLIGDDMQNLELSLWSGLFGIGVIQWSAGSESGLSENRPPYKYIFSKLFNPSGFGYGFEAGIRNNTTAVLSFLTFTQTFNRLDVELKLQGRKYDNGFAGDFAGSIEHVYISYDQYDKAYTNSLNIFVYDDNVNVYSAIVNIDFRVLHNLYLESDNEFGQFAYNEIGKRDFYFYRLGVSWFFLSDRNEKLNFFVSNKVLNESYTRPPSEISLTNVPLFRQKDFIGFEIAFRF